jgi:hypothetical protein
MNIVYIWLSYYPPELWRTDILKISNEAQKNNNVIVICKWQKWEQKIEKISDNLTVYRIFSFWLNSILDDFFYCFYIPFFLFFKNIKVDIFHIYNPFYFCFIINILLKVLFIKSKIIFDIRTWPLKKWYKKILNYILINLINITSTKTIIISKNLLKNFFYVQKNKISEISLWFDNKYNNIIKSQNNDEWKKFIYIWSIYKRRNIELMLKIFTKYFENYNNDILYILWWWDDEYIDYLNINYKSKNIIFLWQVNQDEVWNYLLKSDFWVAYIPQVDYFMDQPPLKTIEYLWYWLPTIWTNTNWNKLFINEKNWVLCDDSIDSFYEWLKTFRKTFLWNYSGDEITKTIKKYSWENIFNEIYNNIYN